MRTALASFGSSSSRSLLGASSGWVIGSSVGCGEGGEDLIVPPCATFLLRMKLALFERRPGRVIGFLSSTCMLFSPARGAPAVPEAAKNQSKVHAPLTSCGIVTRQAEPPWRQADSAPRSGAFRDVLERHFSFRVVPVRKKCGEVSICCHYDGDLEVMDRSGGRGMKSYEAWCAFMGTTACDYSLNV